MANKPVPAGSRAGAGSQVGGSLLPAGAPPVAWLHRETPRGPWAAPAAEQSLQKRRQEALCDSVPGALLPSVLEPLDQAGGRRRLGPPDWLAAAPLRQVGRHWGPQGAAPREGDAWGPES